MRGTAEARSPATAIFAGVSARHTFDISPRPGAAPANKSVTSRSITAPSGQLCLLRTEAAGCLCRRVIGPARGEEKETDGPC